VVGWLERRGVRCLEVWLDNYLGDLSMNFGLKCCGEGWVVTEIEGVEGWSVCLGLWGGRLAASGGGFVGIGCKRLGE